MEDRFVKYSKLYALIFLLFLSVPVILALIVAAFYGLSKLVSSSLVDVVFGLGVVTMGPALFSAVFFIFLKRTRQHPVAWVRVVSSAIFLIGIGVSAVVLVMDMISFFSAYHIDIARYTSFSLPFMAGNVAILFLVAIIQAFTTQKEVDWMQRKR